jgi:hypothetical protein
MKKQKRKFAPLFTSAQDSRVNASLDLLSPDPLENYTAGYKDAADRLVANILETKNMEHTLIYPICFLYRQYVELRLKEIIRSGSALLAEDRRFTLGFPTGHNINNLYKEAKKTINKVFAGQEKPLDLSFIDHIITEYYKIDPNSESFRYPCDGHGRKYLEGITLINVRHLAENLRKFGEEMDNISFTISVYLDQKHEFREFE